MSATSVLPFVVLVFGVVVGTSSWASIGARQRGHLVWSPTHARCMHLCAHEVSTQLGGPSMQTTHASDSNVLCARKSSYLRASSVSVWRFTSCASSSSEG